MCPNCQVKLKLQEEHNLAHACGGSVLLKLAMTHNAGVSRVYLSTMRLRLTFSAGVFLIASWMWNAKPLTLASASAFLFSGVSILEVCKYILS